MLKKYPITYFGSATSVIMSFVRIKEKIQKYEPNAKHQ